MSPRQLFSVGLGLLVAVASLLSAASASDDYGANEYMTISEGISPNGRLAITIHGQGEHSGSLGVYLFDAVAGKKICLLERISEVMDANAEGLLAKWNKSSNGAKIIYRTSRVAPLQAMTYRFVEGRAIPATPQPVDVRDDALIRLWQEHRPSGLTFSAMKQRP